MAKVKTDEEMAYSTEHEIDFIYKIGMHSKNKTPRHLILMMYKNACAKRREWNDINQDAAGKHLTQLTGM